MKKGNRVRELGSTGPYNGKVIDVLDTGRRHSETCCRKVCVQPRDQAY